MRFDPNTNPLAVLCRIEAFQQFQSHCITPNVTMHYFMISNCIKVDKSCYLGILFNDNSKLIDKNNFHNKLGLLYIGLLCLTQSDYCN